VNRYKTVASGRNRYGCQEQIHASCPLLFGEIYHDHWGIPLRQSVKVQEYLAAAPRLGLTELAREVIISWTERTLESSGHLCLAAAERLKAMRSRAAIAPPRPLRLVECR
jgi:hypothetical protein